MVQYSLQPFFHAVMVMEQLNETGFQHFPLFQVWSFIEHYFLFSSIAILWGIIHAVLFKFDILIKWKLLSIKFTNKTRSMNGI